MMRHNHILHTALAILFYLLPCILASAEEYVVAAKFSRPSSMGESFMYDFVVAENQEDAIDKYKKKLLDKHSDYEIKILQVCTKNTPQICTKF